MDKVKKRLNRMTIQTGNLIGEPIAIMYYYKSTKWSGTIRICEIVNVFYFEFNLEATL